ncbi:hypothetical protein NX059_000997 [Plenodomus lindquistii]|nr:hypothetical protein NX059_000997 [Plenodomus lindquistii]
MGMDSQPAESTAALQPFMSKTTPFPIITDVPNLQNVIADLRQENEGLRKDLMMAKAEVRAASDRAQIRYQDKVRANRNAERFEQKLMNERMEREDDQIKAVRCFTHLKEMIACLKKGNVICLQSGREDSTAASTAEQAKWVQTSGPMRLQGDGSEASIAAQNGLH